MTAQLGRPLDPNDPDVRKLALIELALQRNVPWAVIATALKAKDKAHAKKIKAELEKRVNAKQYALPDALTSTVDKEGTP